jgi:hypothetical protein
MVLKPEANIPFSGGDWIIPFYYGIDTTQNIDTVSGISSRFYELRNQSNDSVVQQGQHGIQIQYVLDGQGVVKNRLIIHSSNNEYPTRLSVNNIVPQIGTEFWIESGDIVRGYGATDDTHIWFEFICFTEMLYRAENVDYSKSIEFDTVTNSIKYVVGFSWGGVFVQQQSTSNLLYYHNYSVPNTEGSGSTYTGYITFDPEFFDSFDGTWSLRSYSQTISSVVVANDPPENDPPSSPVFVPPVFIRGSGRRGNLNFW